ncbi:hypothetical protein [Pyrofollis japonicus]|uniref:hypothetical protein n=1 Tax=Pyrofollis japonicus TaxID=3060460 RepID=UPI00295B2D7A|nr:hypothetical protein [Pyrofollis japonicus]
MVPRLSASSRRARRIVSGRNTVSPGRGSPHLLRKALLFLFYPTIIEYLETKIRGDLTPGFLGAVLG